ncbi:hypothetical protein PLICRDRAFT_171634 [Plicaturopsis crispa FD-325 SS-3]|nr:hypothetical protein PLICRDRAFT_171634 [Plicaturopsis crispa FD-325 SS-3]
MEAVPPTLLLQAAPRHTAAVAFTNTCTFPFTYPPTARVALSLETFKMPTEFERRQKNTKFANAARAGKKPTKPSRQELLSKRSPVSLWALGIVLFVVVGGVLFELARILFL